jgi:stage II sporulation SpoE-like protein
MRSAMSPALVIDAVGHGFPATVLAGVAVGAYRHARRNAADLPDIAAEVNAAIAGQFGHSLFATALLAHPPARPLSPGRGPPNGGAEVHGPVQMQEVTCSRDANGADVRSPAHDSVVETGQPG